MMEEKLHLNILVLGGYPKRWIRPVKCTIMLLSLFNRLLRVCGQIETFCLRFYFTKSISDYRRHQHYKRRKSSLQDGHGHQSWRRQNEGNLLPAPNFSIGGGPLGTNRRVSVQPEDATLEVSRSLNSLYASLHSPY